MKQLLTVLVSNLFRSRPAALVLAMLCLLGPTNGFGQGFELSFGGPKNDYGRAVLQTEDRGYLTVGATEGELGDDNDLDIFVVRTDVDGTELWSRSYDLGFIEQADDVTRTIDDGFVITGYLQSSSTAAEQSFLMKLAANGDVEFTRTYGTEGRDQRARQISPVDGGYLMTGYRSDATGSRNAPLLTRLDADGNVLWNSEIATDNGGTGVGALPTPTGYVLGANVLGDRGIANDAVLYGLDATGNLLWTKRYGTADDNEQINDILPTTDGQHLVFVGSRDNFNIAYLAKADLNGDTLWMRSFDASPFDDELRGVTEEANGEFFVGVGQTVPTPANLDVLMVKVRATDGNVEWTRRLGDEDALDVAEDLVPTREGGYALAAFNSRGLSLFNDLTLFQTDNFGDLQTNFLRGRVYYPADQDCRPYQDGDQGLAGWLVRAESDRNVFFGSTDSLGNYDLRVDTALYTVTLLPKNNRWNICGPTALTADLRQTYDSVFHDFAVSPAIDCPLLEVTASATPAIQCDTQRITLHYGNTGTDVATAASVVFELDSNLTFLSASVAPDEINGRELVWEVGDLVTEAAGDITLLARVGCSDVTDGQAIQSTARIFPIVACAPASPDWDGSSIVVTGRCDRTAGISFTLTNVGLQDMTQDQAYIIVEDIILRQRSTFQLASGASRDIQIPFNGSGSTYRLIAEQSPGHPGNLFPTAVVEGCTAADLNDFSTGFAAQFPDNDGDRNLDILTQEIVALSNEEPVRLTVFPRGYQDSIVFPKTDLEYTVFFTVPHNEFTERVVIRDTLPPELDLSSLEMGAASHPYNSVLYQGGILKITFDSIRFFADGGAGEADPISRRGYVTYRLSQGPNLTPGTTIRNRAAVYFDYQTPLQTEFTRRTVGCNNLFSEDGDCLTSNVLNLPKKDGVFTDITPNPVSTHATVRVRGAGDLQRARKTFRLYDVNGREIFRRTFRSDFLRFERPDVAGGAYFYSVTGGGYLLGNGQIVLP